MGRYDLLHARQRLRGILRRTASLEGSSRGAFLALDEKELVKRADLADRSAQGDAVKRHLILLGLSQLNLSIAAIATAWDLDVATVAAWKSVPLVDPSGRASEIEQQVLDELPQTPEPGPHIAPAP